MWDNGGAVVMNYIEHKQYWMRARERANERVRTGKGSGRHIVQGENWCGSRHELKWPAAQRISGYWNTMHSHALVPRTEFWTAGDGAVLVLAAIGIATMSIYHTKYYAVFLGGFSTMMLQQFYIRIECVHILCYCWNIHILHNCESD